MKLRFLTTLLAGSLVLGCASAGRERAAGGPRPWDGELQVYGALRALFHEGRIGAQVALDELLPDPHLYAVGALAELAGEVTVVAGKVYLSYPQGETARTESPALTKAAATLLVAARVPAWRSVTTRRPLRLEELDVEIAGLAATAGFAPDARFPFLLEGSFEELEWHVIDGSRLPGGEASHHDHRKAGVQVRRERASAILVGFYSTSDQGVFTHRGSRTHVHCVLPEPLATGHVDHVLIPAGTTVKLPAGAG